MPRAAFEVAKRSDVVAAHLEVPYMFGTLWLLRPNLGIGRLRGGTRESSHETYYT